MLDPRYFLICLRLAVGVGLLVLAFVGADMHIASFRKPPFDPLPVRAASACFACGIYFLARALEHAAWFPGDEVKRKVMDEMASERPRHPETANDQLLSRDQ